MQKSEIAPRRALNLPPRLSEAERAFPCARHRDPATHRPGGAGLFRESPVHHKQPRTPAGRFRSIMTEHLSTAAGY
jgi:hypothetical protein